MSDPARRDRAGAARPLELTVNGRPERVAAPAHATLLGVLREDLGLTGAKQGCEDGECGACTVLLDGRPVAACILLAHQADGRDVRTVEGVGTTEAPHPLQRALVERGAVQCGFCTPGIVMAALGAFADPSWRPGEQEVRQALAGNLCRCTGYQKVVEAVLAWTADPQREEHRGPAT
jgi:carbon-monoxide dehydrogenase small subunit